MNSVLTGRNLILPIFISVFVVMLCFNMLTPMASDDYAHYYGVEDEHVTTIQGMLHSMSIFRIYANGRVISHFLVYIFLALPRIAFQVINALIAAGIVILLSRFFVLENSLKEAFLLVSASFALWLFTPSFGEVYLWLSGSINYSWGLALDLLFVFPFYCEYTGKKKSLVLEKGHILRKILFAVLAFSVGAYSENGAAATICVAGLLGLLIWIQNKVFPKYLFFVFLCAIAGFIFLITAPATLTTRTGGDIREHIWFCRVLTQKYMTILWIVYALLLLIAFLSGVNKKLILFTIVLLIASCLSIAVFVFAIYLPPRSFMIAVSFSILAICCLEAEMWCRRKSKVLFIIPVATAAFFLFSFPKGAKDICYLHELQREREFIIKTAVSSKDSVAYIPRFVTETDYPACPEEELSEDGSFWYNNLIAKYYGIGTVYAEPDK